MDRAYTNLLAQLHNASPSLPLTTIQNALAHYLAHISPLPTPLAASAVSSAFYLAQPFSNDKLQSLLTAFRHATHLQYTKQKNDAKNRSRLGNFFSKSLNAALGQWIDDVVKGIQGGHPILRLSSLSGLVLGICDLEAESKKKQIDETYTYSLHFGNSKSDVEEELIVAVAEVMDTYSYGPPFGSPNSWEEELKLAGRDVLTLALIIAAQSLPLVSQARFDILPLPTLNHLALVTLSSIFCGGKFLRNLSTSIIQQGGHKIFIKPASPVAQALHAIAVSPAFISTAPLSRLAARSLRSRLESYSDFKKSEGLRAASETLQLLRDMSKQLEHDWLNASLAGAAEHDIAPDSRPITQKIWSILKTVLFSTIMLSDAILASVVYIQPQSIPYVQASTSSSELALCVLEILSSFAFIISQFGGITSTSQGFEHMKKTFYLALDILAQEGRGIHDDLANTYVKDQCLVLRSSAITGAPVSFRNAKIAIVLASIEQLIPILDEANIRDYVFDACWPHLSDPTHRETFESAHSVILSVFASHAQRQQLHPRFPVPHTPRGKSDGVSLHAGNSGIMSKDLESSDFVMKMVPFYAHSLLENSANGRLSTPQLRMAFAALVRCAGVGGLNVDNSPEESTSLAWYCIQLLLDAIHPGEPAGETGKRRETDTSIQGDMNEERLHRLRLTLISAVPSLPLALMLQTLEKIKLIITSIPPSSSNSISSTSSESNPSSGERKVEGDTRDELVKALFQEIMGQIGYREKSVAMHWWYENRMKLQASSLTSVPPTERVSDEDDTVMTAS